MNKYKFLDYNIDWFFNDMFAIEPEINNIFYRDNFELWPNKIKHMKESSKIFEIVWLHNEDSEFRLNVHNIIQKQYIDKFPIWANKRLSWGVHFHVFNWTLTWIPWEVLKDNTINCPLFCKIWNNKLYSRQLTNRANFGDRSIPTNSKRTYVSYKTSHSTSRRSDHFKKRSLEFRCNNVFDARIYWYYVALIIAAKEWIKLKSLSSTIQKYVRTWNMLEFDLDKDHYKLSEISWVRIDDENKEILIENCNTLLKVLEDNTLVNAAIALKEYLNEVWIKITREIYLRDNFSNEKFTWAYPIKDLRIARILYWNLFFNTKENFYNYVIQELKTKMQASNIAQWYYEINIDWVKKWFKKYLINNNTNDNWERQLFECASVLNPEERIS